MRRWSRATSWALALALACAAIAALALAWPSPATAAPSFPPPPIDAWPAAGACAGDTSRLSSSQRHYCEIERYCSAVEGDPLRADEYARVRAWCEAVAEAETLELCREELKGGLATGLCGTQKEELERRCAGRGLSDASAWVCAQLAIAYPKPKPSKPKPADKPKPKPTDKPKPGSTPPPAGSGPCTPDAPDAEERERCRAHNETLWRENRCAANLHNPAAAADDAAARDELCRSYGTARHRDLCPEDRWTGPGKPDDLAAFCAGWPTSWYNVAAQPGGPPAPGGEEEDTGASDGGAPAEGAPDVLAALGARSPLCSYPARLSAEQRKACEESGSPSHRFPLSHYSLDFNAPDTGALSALTSPLQVTAAGVQFFFNALWMIGLWLLKGVLLGTEWAFEVPLITGCAGGSTGGTCTNALPQVAEAAQELHEEVLGTPWTMAAFAIAGLWGMWRGLVRQRFNETFSGLAATIVLMVVALVIIYNPAGTIGKVAKVSNDAALATLHLTSSFGDDNPTNSFAEAQRGLFHTLVVRPWCALQFAEVEYCLRKRSGGTSVADVWLAQPSASATRTALYQMTKGEQTGDGLFGVRSIGGLFDGGPDEAESAELKASLGDAAPAPERVGLQELVGTPQRGALLVLVMLTQLGAIVVVGWVSIRLVTAAVAALFLLLLAAAMLLVAAFGEGGRNATVNYFKQLLAALVAKFLLALILTIVVVLSGILAELDLDSWFAVWLLQLAFWWGIIARRQQLIGILQLDPQAASGARGGNGLGLMQAYFGYRAVREVSSDVGTVLGAPLRMMRGREAAQRLAQSGALRDRAARTATQRARDAEGLERGLARRTRAGLNARRDGVERDLAAKRKERAEHQRGMRQVPQGLRDKASDAKSKRDALERAKEQALQRAAEQERRRDLLAKRARLADLEAKHSEAMGGPDAPGTRRLRQQADDLVLQRDAAEAARRAAMSDHVDIRDKQLPTAEHELVAARDARDSYKPDPADEARLAGLEREEQDLLEERRAIDEELRANRVREGELSEGEARRRWEDRRAAVERGAAEDAPEQLVWAGVDPDDYAYGTPAEREEMRERSRAAMERDRELAARLDSEVLPNAEHVAELRDAHRDPGFDAEVRRRVEADRVSSRLDQWVRRWRR